jgi:hypothetical protein
MIIVKPEKILDANVLASNVPENDYPIWAGSDTDINLGDRRMVIETDVHLIYESLIDGNIGNSPLNELTPLTPKWVLVGKNNRWRMFDELITSVTTQAESITSTVTDLNLVTAMSFLNMDCTSIRVVGTDIVEGTFYDQTAKMTSDAGIVDEYEWCWAPIQKVTDYAFTEIPPYYGATFDITILAPGYNASCGAVVGGYAREYSAIRYGAKVSTVDYSKKEIDQWGNYSFVEGDFSKTLDAEFFVDNDFVDQLQYVFAEFRAIPALYIGSTLFGSSIIWGKYDKYEIVIAYPTQSLVAVELQALI